MTTQNLLKTSLPPITLALLIVLAVFASFQKSSLEEDVLERVLSDPELEKYSEFPVEIKHLTAEEVAALAKEQPVLYDGVDAAVYKLEFDTGSGVLFVLYDQANDEILKQFEIMSVGLG